jgi:hypothetical protein
MQWEMINAYGPLQDDRKPVFLPEKIQSINYPFVIGGGFNFIRYV